MKSTAAMLLLLLLPRLWAFGQPFLELYLESKIPASRGAKISAIDEEHEIHVSGKSYSLRKTYNAHGQIMHELGKNSRGGRSNERRWEYRSNGDLIRRSGHRFMNSLGWTPEEVELRYNDSTGFLESIHYSVGDSFKQQAEVQCDSTGMPIEAKVYNSKGGLSHIERVMVIPANNCIRVLRHTPSGLLSGSYNYPIDHTKPVPTNNLKREFNEQGDVVLEALEGQLKYNQAYYYEYEYDAHGNWIKRDTYQCSIGTGNRPRNKKLEYTITRRITY
ncbi:MAG: hypothetical protein IJU72_10250 [Bacteroidales bacterium]|nr:hypothetical protein [Bacteroidales bacterium]